MMKILISALLMISTLAFAEAENPEQASRALQQAKKVAKEETRLRPAHAYELGSLAAKRHKALQVSRSNASVKPEVISE